MGLGVRGKLRTKDVYAEGRKKVHVTIKAEETITKRGQPECSHNTLPVNLG